MTVAAILVVVLINSAGNAYTHRHYEFPDLATCQRAIQTALVLPPSGDDRRGVQAMFCVPGPKP